MKSNSNILLTVPYYSQRLDVRRSLWRPRACGVVALKMAMEYINQKQKIKIKNKIPNIDQLVDLGVAIHARDPIHGWIHNGLVVIAKLNGFKRSYRKEWQIQIKNKNGKVTIDEKEAQKGIRYIVGLLRHDTPVLVSMMSRTGGHLVVVTGFQEDTVYKHSDILENVGMFFYHDPNAKTRNEGKNKKITREDFIKCWKGRIVVVKK
jgi:uncharacterized protein YvpB